MHLGLFRNHIFFVICVGLSFRGWSIFVWALEGGAYVYMYRMDWTGLDWTGRNIREAGDGWDSGFWISDGSDRIG